MWIVEHQLITTTTKTSLLHHHHRLSFPHSRNQTHFHYQIAMSTFFEIHQLDQLRAIFTRFDMDSDGSLTLLELAALLRSLGVKTSSGDQVHALLAAIDANSNGKVEFDEFVTSISPNLLSYDVLVNQEQLLGVFRSFDRDGNRYITLAELAGSMAKMGQPLTYRELTEMVREADTDGDGVISFNEFASIMDRSAGEMFGFSVS